MADTQELQRLALVANIMDRSLSMPDTDDCVADLRRLNRYIIYKLPELPLSKNELEKKGLAYYYLDVTTPRWSRGADSLNGTNHAIYHTLQQTYSTSSSEDHMHIFYNDEAPPKHTSMSHGHTKGSLGFDKQSGYWLVHSLPRFPPVASEAYTYPHSGIYYGQTFLCMTLPYDMLDKVGRQLLYNWPQVYDSSLPQQFADENHNIVEVLEDKHVKQEPWNSTMLLYTEHGQEFTSLAKFTHYDADLYSSWVAPYIDSSIAVESWQHHGGEDLPSYCGLPYQVHNVATLHVSETAFGEHKDHSKWAVSMDTKRTWVCIGDINRQKSQEQRAGGTVCINKPAVWKAFKSSIMGMEPCPQPKQVDERIVEEEQAQPRLIADEL